MFYKSLSLYSKSWTTKKVTEPLYIVVDNEGALESNILRATALEESFIAQNENGNECNMSI